MKRCNCVSPVTVLLAFGLGLVLSYCFPPTFLVIVLAFCLFILCCIRIRH